MDQYAENLQNLVADFRVKLKPRSFLEKIDIIQNNRLIDAAPWDEDLIYNLENEILWIIRKYFAVFQVYVVEEW